MNDDKLSTAGSFKITCASACCRSGHGGERNILRGVGNALDHAGVLHGKKSFRHDDIKQNRDHQRRDGHEQSRRLAGETHCSVRP
jgi:hypothetical protein